MKVLVACEYSGTVRDAFLARGHDAWSCDLLPDERGSNRHIRGDVLQILDWGWDLMMVAHPPCTRLCKSGLRWLHTPPPGRTMEEMQRELEEGCRVFSALWAAPIPRVVIENPRMHRLAQERITGFVPPHQVVQPWWFGDPVFKALCLWIRGVPRLKPSNPLEPPPYGSAQAKTWERIHRMPARRDRRRERARFFPGTASAFADQWGGFVTSP
jgi:hypothetical protein